jgi:mono/diheme cytochrome c family protein/plastocyanin
LKSEWLARLLLLALALSLPVVAATTRWMVDDQSIELHGMMPEVGGWMPGNLKAQVGKPLYLRLTSDDVMHGFAIGRQDWPAVDVKPGQVTEVTLTFDQPGTYTYYCTRWCGPNHWRMRGTIEVEGGQATEIKEPAQPLYVTLGTDLDAPHETELIPVRPPSAEQGATLKKAIPSALLASDVYLSESPSEVWRRLRDEPEMAHLADDELWDLVAFIWQSNSNSEAIQIGQTLYDQNCAACHGETGAGDGVMTVTAGSPGNNSDDVADFGHNLMPATDFTDAQQMLGASSALLQGKILRGGMGTGMPNWGTIFTEEQSWALVDYLWTIPFQVNDR